jgi:hypothetical protein
VDRKSREERERGRQSWTIRETKVTDSANFHLLFVLFVFFLLLLLKLLSFHFSAHCPLHFASSLPSFSLLLGLRKDEVRKGVREKEIELCQKGRGQ